MYPPTYQCPPKAKANIVCHISRLSTLSTALDEAVTDLMKECKAKEEENKILRNVKNNIDDSNSFPIDFDIAEAVCPKGVVSTPACAIIDDDFKNGLLEKLDKAYTDITWHHNPTLQHHDTHDECEHEYGQQQQQQIKEPPAALLRGNLKYYNRMNGQWRIVVSNAILRPRFNIDYRKKNKKRNCTSLWDQSIQSMSTSVDRQSKRMRKNIDDDNANDDEIRTMKFETKDDGGIVINGDLVILAYDDII